MAAATASDSRTPVTCSIPRDCATGQADLSDRDFVTAGVLAPAARHTTGTPTDDIRRSHERGQADHGWLQFFHSFAFADYFDPRFSEFGVLRVLNEDRVRARAGFRTRSHQNMEIVSYMLSGQLAHQDSMGNGSTIRPGDVRRMSAGSGITHSEFNPSPTKTLHFIQIWIRPNARNFPPEYEERRFSRSEKRGQLRLVVSPDGTDGSLSIHQDAKLYAGLFDHDEVALLSSTDRALYVHVARGELSANEVTLVAGDALRIVDGCGLRLDRGRGAEVLVFDLPPVRPGAS
jgi:quercetin 2,3-dioxygenase